MIGKKINQLATELAPVSTDLTIIGDPDSGVSKKITLAQLGAIFSGAVSFYTNLASFPAVGDINVIYCAKDTQKLYLWSGSAYVEVFPSQALLNTYQLRSEKGVSNGYASLDSAGKVPISQLPSSIMEYKGTWNAATNTPTLANGTGDTGDVYICNVAGTVNFGAGAITFAVGDYVIYSGTIWQRSSGAVGTVTSVAASITGDSVTISGSPVTTSGTLAFAFAGTGAQYIKGDGTLATFPTTIDQAKNLITEIYNNTGATLTKGTIVYITGGQGNLPTVSKALATTDATSAQTYGVVQTDITNMNNGFVVVAGRLTDIDTQAYSNGTQLYLSPTTAGTWTSTKPTAPNHMVYVGIIVRSHPTQGVVEIKIQNGLELIELADVSALTPSNNDGLFWEASTSLWKNKSIATILGYTPQAQLNGTGFVKASGTTITYDNSTYLTTSAASTTYLPMVLSSTANVVDINGQQFNIWGSAGGYTSGRIIVDPVFSAIGYQNAGVFDGLKILTNGNAEFSNSGITRFFNQVRFDSTLTNGTYTYTLPGATGTLALVSQLTGGTVTSVGLSVPTGFAVSGSPVTSSGTLALAFDTGYSLPTIVKQNNWDTAYNTRIVTASSPLSFISNTISISQASGSANGFLSSTDWTTFNNKQNALTNPVTGTGTTNYLPKFTGTSTIGNSLVYDNGTNILIGKTTSTGGLVQISNGTNMYNFDYDASGPYFTTVNNANTVYKRFTLDASELYFNIAASTKMVLNSSGNLGLGVSPSASQDPILESRYGLFMGRDETNLLNNAYFNSGWKYAQTGSFANRYYQNGYNGGHQWLIAPSGTAGNAISFTQAMTLNASGNLSLGNTNDTYKLDVTGTGRFSESLYVLKSTNSGSGSVFPTMQVKNTLATQGDGSSTFNFSGVYVGSGNDAVLMTMTTTYAAGTWAPAGILNVITNHDLQIKTNNATRLTIAAGGAATFSSSVRATGLLISDDRLYMPGNQPISNWFSSSLSAGYSSSNSYAWVNGATNLVLGTDGSERMRITSGGLVGLGLSSPTEKLHLKDSATGYVGLRLEGSSTYAGSDWTIYASSTSPSTADDFLGFYNNSTTDSASAGYKMRIFKSGIINLSNVPSSSAGLSSGDIYKSAGVLMIV